MAVKNVLFFVHGVGEHEEGWSTEEGDGPQKALEKVSEYYSDRFPTGDINSNPLSNSLNFVEIRYDDIFERVRSTWNDLANSLVSDKFPGATPNAVGEIAGHFAGLTKPDKWYATHALDAFMYGGFPLIRQVIRHSVASQLASGIVEYMPADGAKPTFSIAAHSLGTAVTHDAIQLLGTTAWMKYGDIVPEGIGSTEVAEFRDRYGDNPFSPGQFKWQALFMIANVSRIFCDPKPDSDRSIVRPSFSSMNDRNAARYYYNFVHTMDPIGLVSRFSAAKTWPRAAAEGFAEDRIDLRHFYDKNIHGFAHYIKHPFVHGRILRRVVPTRFKDEQLALADARVLRGGDFSNFGIAMADDDMRGKFLDNLLPLVAAATGQGKPLNRLRDAFEQFGQFVV